MYVIQVTLMCSHVVVRQFAARCCSSRARRIQEHAGCVDPCSSYPQPVPRCKYQVLCSSDIGIYNPGKQINAGVTLMSTLLVMFDYFPFMTSQTVGRRGFNLLVIEGRTFVSTNFLLVRTFSFFRRGGIFFQRRSATE